jgi:NAD(P)-dependent dehydrogenase (short-subunit alcohol dehydrogenase family)
MEAIVAIALVTGTSSGIGLATAVTLARGGHKVIATMRNVDGAGELRKIILAERLPISVAALNVDDDGSVSDAVDRVILENGRIDVLVNNAGVGGRGSVEEVPMEVFRQVMETNFFGGLRCIKAVIPSMREQHRGCIVNVTSVAGRIASAARGPYAASKWAFEALSECLAQELKAFNIRVAIIEPGVIATPIFGKLRPGPNDGDSLYPHLRRLRARISASLTKAISPYVVAELIRQIVEGDSWQLRYPVGPDAVSLIKWRAGKTDEEVVDLGAESDADYKARMKQEFGLDLNL